MAELPFVVNDRRGQKKEPRVVEHDQFDAIEAAKDKSSFKDVAYLIIPAQTPGGLMIVGRAVGLRSDDRVFIADWIFPPIWHEGLEWTKMAYKRLETFLNCGCTERGGCADHRVYNPQWLQADTNRLNMLAGTPLSPALEAFMKTQQSQSQARVVTPGR